MAGPRTKDVDVGALVAGVVKRDRGSVARCLRVVDDEPALARQIAAELYAHRTGARVLGITGNPGAGKSTVVDKIIGLYRKDGKSVAVLAVDPSSPFSGGAILGDRIRMSKHFEDDGVFIRSLATRGALGGLSRSTFDSVRVLDAAGYDVVLIETVGVGQDEVDVVRLAETTVVIMVPGMGDDVQAIKAGLLEIADIFLLNKADREGVPDLERGLRHMLGLVPLEEGDWEPPILKSVAPKGEGLPALLEAVDKHRAYLAGPAGGSRVEQRNRELFDRLLDAALVQRGRAALADELAAARNRVQGGSADPYAEVMALVEKLG